MSSASLIIAAHPAMAPRRRTLYVIVVDAHTVEFRGCTGEDSAPSPKFGGSFGMAPNF